MGVPPLALNHLGKLLHLDKKRLGRFNAFATGIDPDIDDNDYLDSSGVETFKKYTCTSMEMDSIYWIFWDFLS